MGQLSNLPNFNFLALCKKKKKLIKKVMEIKYRNKEKFILYGEILTWKVVNEQKILSCQRR